MNRKQAKDMLPIIQALAEGKHIQLKDKTGNWMDIDFINVELCNPNVYRIKSEPVYRPFNNTKECWNEMQKHQPIGWVKSKEATEDVYFTITGLTNDTHGAMLNSSGGWSFCIPLQQSSSLLKRLHQGSDLTRYPFGLKS